MADQKPRRNIMIIGAGLVGSLLAVLFRKKGYEVSLFEKRPDIRKVRLNADRSINLVITSRGLNGLDQAGLLDQALKLSVPIFGRMIHPVSGDLAYQPYGNESECNFSISRSKLNEFLLDAAEAAGAKLHFEHGFHDVDFGEKSVTFACPGQLDQVVKYDLMFGTDGAGSRVRKMLCDKLPQYFSEKTDWLEADYKELFLPAGHDGKYLLEKNALHIWPRGSHMMMGLANLDGSFTMTLYMPKEKMAGVRSRRDVEELFKSEFPDAIPLMPDYQDEFINHPQGRLGTVRTTRWVYEDSVVLLGDAAHAIVPFFGQGMNSGFEDCTELMRFIGGDSSWAEALADFEKTQKANANAIADMALENWSEMRDKVGDTRFLLRKKVEALLEKKFPQYYKSRYGMVTYTLNPYVQAKAAGRIQDKILARLCENLERAEDISYQRAEEMLKAELALFNSEHEVKLGTDPLVARARYQAGRS